MIIALITEYDCRNPNIRSGVPYHIYKGFLENGHLVEMVLVKDKRVFFDKLASKIYQFYYHILLNYRKGSYNAFWSKALSKAYAKSIKQIDFSKYDLAITISTITCAYVNIKCPLVVWIDNTYESFYSNKYYCSTPPILKIKNESYDLDSLSFNKAQKVFVASGWLRNRILGQFQIDENKISILPRGANLTLKIDNKEVKKMIHQKIQSEVCNILFISSDWERKGGNIVINTFKELQRKMSCTLTIIGNIKPKVKEDFFDPSISYLGFINKSSEDSFEIYFNLFKEAHFLLVPSKADGFGIVYAEAASFGVPSLAYAIMGVTESVKDGVTGKLLPEVASAEDFANLILNLWNNKDEYKQLSEHAYNYAAENFDWVRNTQIIAKNFQ